MKQLKTSIGWVGTLALAMGLAGCLGESAEQLIASAKSHIEKNDNKAALIQLKNALQKDASSAEARFLLGELLLQSGDVAGAAIELGKAAELGFDSEELAPTMAKVLLQQGHAEKVIVGYAQLSLADPKALADLKTTIAAAYQSTGKPAQARESIDQALKADPEHGQAQLLNVRLLAGDNRKDDALKALDDVLAKKPAFSQAWQLKGDALLSTGAGEDAALAAYQEAVKHDKNNLAAQSGVFLMHAAKADYEAAQLALKQLEAVAPKHPQVRFYAAALALQRKDLKTAHEQVQALLKTSPENASALHLAGTVAFRRGEHVQAEAYLKQAVQRAPGLISSRLMLARTYLRGGDAKKVLATVQGLTDGTSPNAEALAIAAEAHLLQGDAKLAEEYFNRATKLNPKDKRSRTALAIAQIGKGQTQQGIEELRAISADDDSVLANMALISALVRKNDYEQALRAVDALERKQPGQPTAAALRGRLELARGNPAKAREGFEAALKLAPGYLPALVTLAAMDVADKKPGEAVQRFERVLETDPQSVQSHLALINLRTQAGASKEELIERLSKAIKHNPQAPQPRLALIRLQLDRKEYKLAVSAAQDGIAAIPDNADMLGALAQAQMAAGDYNQALSAANKAVSLQPDSPLPLLRLAELQIGHKDKDAATQTLKRALALKPDLLPAQSMLVGLASDAGRVAEARSIIRNLQAQHPSSGAAFSMEGDLEFGAKNWAAAMAAYRKGLEKAPASSLAVKLHMSLLAAGKNDEAKRHEAQWMARFPKDAGFLFYLGDQALSQNNLTLAQSRYEAVLKLQPDNAAATNNVAWLLFKAGKPGALEYAQKANTLQPKQPAFMDTLAEIQAGAGQLDMALETQKEAVALAPAFHPHRLRLAELYVRTGKKAEAAQELKQLAELGDKFPRQDEVKRLQAGL